MSAGQTIAKLEALLARVTKRAAEPRAMHAAAAPAEPEEPADMPTRPPPPGAMAPQDIEVELPEPAIEVRTPPPPAPSAAQSDERIVAAAPVAIPIEEEIEVLAGEPEAEAEEERAPASSRRPVGPPPAEVLEKKAFGDEAPEPVIHTPPPESGKLPAALELTPIVEAADYDSQDITGVHHTPARPHAEDAPARAHADDVLAQSGEAPIAAELVPEVTRATVGAKAPVADVIGVANAFAPTSIGELLDATLKL